VRKMWFKRTGKEGLGDSCNRKDPNRYPLRRQRIFIKATGTNLKSRTNSPRERARWILSGSNLWQTNSDDNHDTESGKLTQNNRKKRKVGGRVDCLRRPQFFHSDKKMEPRRRAKPSKRSSTSQERSKKKRQRSRG